MIAGTILIILFWLVHKGSTTVIFHTVPSQSSRSLQVVLCLPRRGTFSEFVTMPLGTKRTICTKCDDKVKNIVSCEWNYFINSWIERRTNHAIASECTVFCSGKVSRHHAFKNLNVLSHNIPQQPCPPRYKPRLFGYET